MAVVPPQDQDSLPPIWQRILSYTGYVLLWLVYAAVTLWLVFQFEQLVVSAAMRLRLNPWQVSAMDRFSLFLAGLAWLVSMLLVEGYLRDGVGLNQLLRRTRKVYFGLSIAVAVVAGLNLII